MEMTCTKENKRIYYNYIKSFRLSRPFHLWMTFLSIWLVFYLYAYYRQLNEGLGVTGMRDFVSWGIYISNFVFFIATSLTGVLVGSVLSLLHQRWILPVTRTAELVAFAFAFMAGLLIITDMGRPERLLNIILNGNLNSPLVWDFTLLFLYVFITMLLFFIHLIPDLSYLKENSLVRSSWQRKLYRKLSFSWADLPDQQRSLSMIRKILIILVIPVAIGIHTVTSWLFALTPRAGWRSTIFGPYFISGAFVSGVSALIIVTFIIRATCNLKEFIHEKLFANLGWLLVIVSLIYLYFNINEYFVLAYHPQKNESDLLRELISGNYAVIFWIAGITGIILPSFLPMFRIFRRRNLLFMLSILTLTGSWLLRYLIVVPILAHPVLPVQNVPEEFTVYKPTLTEAAITIGPIILVIMFISLMAKIFPLVPLRESVSGNKNAV